MASRRVRRHRRRWQNRRRRARRGGATRIGSTRQLLDGHDTHRVGRSIDSDNATAAGLTCGGAVEVLLQRLDVIPAPLWESLAAGHAVALATVLERALDPGRRSSRRQPVDGSLGTLASIRRCRQKPTRCSNGRAPRSPASSFGDVDVAVEAWDPTPRLLIVGASDLSAALQRQAELIGWSASTMIRSRRCGRRDRAPRSRRRHRGDRP